MGKLSEKIRKYLHRQDRKGTVRFMFPALISAAAILGASLIAATDTSYVSLSASKTMVEAGSRFSVDIYAYANTAVNAVNVTLNFDGDKITVSEVDRGQSVITVWTKDPTVEKNRVILSGGTYRRGFIGKHKIASVDFVAEKSGQVNLSVSDVLFLAGDGEATPVLTSETLDSSAVVYVYGQGDDPSQIKIKINKNLATDLDGDGEVTLKDISAFMGAWSNKSKFYDFNGDNKMTIRDLSIILANYFF